MISERQYCQNSQCCW